MATATIAAVGLAAGLHGAYVPGKFMSFTGPYLQWAARRRYFVVPYAVTWLLYVALCSHADW